MDQDGREGRRKRRGEGSFLKIDPITHLWGGWGGRDGFGPIYIYCQQQLPFHTVAHTHTHTQISRSFYRRHIYSNLDSPLFFFSLQFRSRWLYNISNKTQWVAQVVPIYFSIVYQGHVVSASRGQLTKILDKLYFEIVVFLFLLVDIAWVTPCVIHFAWSLKLCL